MTPRSAWLKSLRRQLLNGLCVRRTNGRRRRSGLATSVEWLESRALLAVTLVPEPAGGVEGLAGHVVEFRKGPAGSIFPSDTLASADALFALPVANAGVIADATDNGVAVINYVDAATDNVFPLPRDVGIPPLTAVKVTGAPGGPNSGTFNPVTQDDDFAMKSSGFIDIPTAGSWTFSVRSDDGERLLIGNDHAVVTIFDGARGAATDSTTVTVPRPGFYQYQLTWVNGSGGAVGEFFAQGPNDPSPVLVGDTANGGLSVIETYDPPLAITGQTIDATEGATFSGTVATFTDSDPLAVAGIFSATINWGDGTTTAGSIIVDPQVSGQFDVQGIHTYAEEGHYNVQVTVTDTLGGSTATTAFYSQTNLVTDDQSVLASEGYNAAAHTDPNLVNPWGIAAAPTGPFWVSNNGTGKSTLYDGSGNALALVVTIPASGNQGATSPAPTTGVVFNGSTSDFNVAGAGTAAHFIFATEDGTIAAWNSGTTAVLKVDNANFTTGAVYKGLAIGNNGTGNFLYATDFRGDKIDVYDTNFSPVTLGSGGFGTFTDPGEIAGFAPFGIQNIGGQLYVTYALRSGKDDVAGAGNGFVDVFDLSGNFVKRLTTQGTLNSPWGLALAPATFGPFANDLLVGNFGDGRISAFNSTTGAFVGQLADTHNQPVEIDGLWGLLFGNGAFGSPGTLYFTAGLNDEADGLFGNLTLQETATANVADAALLPGPNPPGASTTFTGTGGNNTSVTPGTANAALSAFKSAIGGVNNGATPSPQNGGFRVITWDGVKLDGTDFGGNTTVVDANHVVGIPINRFQNVGTEFEQVYAVSGPASGSDTSTFTTVNPTVTNLFPAFSPSNTFAMFNDNTLDFSFVLPSSPTSTPVPAATRGFGAIFRNVRLADTTSIEFFSGEGSLGKFFAPAGSAGAAEFLGVLFANAVVTHVTITLGTDALFSFDGTHFTAGLQPDDPINGHNLVVTDDFVQPEPVAISAPAALTGTEGATLTSVLVGTFFDQNPLATAADFTGTIDWGDGHTSKAVVTANGSGGFDVRGTNTYSEEGKFSLSVLVQDVGGSQVSLSNTATIAEAAISGSGVNISGAVGVSLTNVLVATFTDAGGAEVLADYNATINWGDGTAATTGTIALASGTFNVSGTHTYAKEGSYPISVVINHETAAPVVTSSAATITAQADLAVAVTAASSVSGGTDITYTITLTNNGPNPALNVTLTDVVPANTTFDGFTEASGFTFTTPAVGSGGTVTSSIGSFAAGASATFTLKVRVGIGTANNTVISDTATAATTTNDTNSTNNSQTATTTVLAPNTMYRLYNTSATVHFFTTHQSEAKMLVAAGLIDESGGNSTFAVPQASAPGAVKLHRLYNPNGGQHYLTDSDGERDDLVSFGWISEGDDGAIFQTQLPGTVEIFRLYNVNNGDHVYTASVAERDMVLAIGDKEPHPWVQHISLGFAFAIGPTSVNSPQSAPAVQMAVAANDPDGAESPDSLAGLVLIDAPDNTPSSYNGTPGTSDDGPLPVDTADESSTETTTNSLDAVWQQLGSGLPDTEI